MNTTRRAFLKAVPAAALGSAVETAKAAVPLLERVLEAERLYNAAAQAKDWGRCITLSYEAAKAQRDYLKSIGVDPSHVERSLESLADDLPLDHPDVSHWRLREEERRKRFEEGIASGLERRKQKEQKRAERWYQEESPTYVDELEDALQARWARWVEVQLMVRR